MLSPDDAFAAQMVMVKAEEGPYSDDPNDAGGQTAWGITEADARAFGYKGAMQDLTWDTALTIYKPKYWLEPALDRICTIDDNIARKLLDAGINCGTVTANKWLQQALTDLSGNGKLFAGPNGVDGLIGSRTVASLNAFVQLRGDQGRSVLVFMLAAQQAANYQRIEENNVTQAEFIYGWQVRAMAIPTTPTTVTATGATT